METGVNHLGWISHYTPISDDLTGHYGAAPEYYGLLAFAQAAKGEQIAVNCDTGGINLTAYATRQNARCDDPGCDQQGFAPGCRGRGDWRRTDGKPVSCGSRGLRYPLLAA